MMEVHHLVFGASDPVLRVDGQIWSNFSRFVPWKRSDSRADPEGWGGGKGGLDPPEKSQKYRVS